MSAGRTHIVTIPRPSGAENPIDRGLRDLLAQGQERNRFYGQRVFGPLPEPATSKAEPPAQPVVSGVGPPPEAEPDNRTPDQVLADAEIALLVARHRARLAEGER